MTDEAAGRPPVRSPPRPASGGCHGVGEEDGEGERRRQPPHRDGGRGAPGGVRRRLEHRDGGHPARRRPVHAGRAGRARRVLAPGGDLPLPPRKPGRVHTGARHPRGNADWPLVGIFAQRGKDRPNRLGVSRCWLLGVEGLDVRVRGLDAVHGTPVLDLKPYMAEFGPQGEVRQPDWATELMRAYY
ncbi:TrmO family methyltransferase domain-containing protein [Streptomyces litchfieldiae]|uniref:TrmO family methyltransferase n=1 Tax=Streptomyces litchfieldiae TaxID=3075543 RepID=A0ABU2N0N4_9ACTN|nr:TrmO family methyltransferase [Streptomyces sp. DSM 44938]MDT0347467.1 TrmO family methyltransferase [Streptomyces sp. DSM 44938]